MKITSSEPIGSQIFSMWNRQDPFLDDIEQKIGAKIKALLFHQKVKESPQLTYYPTKVRNYSKTPVIMICPGGGYTHRAAHEGKPIAEWLNTQGIDCFVLSYRVAPYRHPIPMLDALQAMRWIRFHSGEFGIEPHQIGVLGFSAGGHLASTIGTHFTYEHPALENRETSTTSSRPDFMILCYPVISFTQSPHMGSVHSLLGKQETPELREYYSNEKKVTVDTPPAFIWHTREDESVPFQHSVVFSEALQHHGVANELWLFDHGSHGLGLAEKHPECKIWTQKCEEWLRKRFTE